MRAAFTCFFMILFYQIYRIQMRIHRKIDEVRHERNYFKEI